MLHILETELLASSKGKACDRPYRAVLVQDELGVVFRVEQPIKGEWFPSGGGWYLSTLLERDTDYDGISIDFGQRWQIDSGLNDAIREACIYLSQQSF
jgi:hypothetical protein